MAEVDLGSELISVQETYLSAIAPRPIGNSLIKSDFYEELKRRVDLVLKYWPSIEQGRQDAINQMRNNNLKLMLLADPEGCEIDYLFLLKEIDVNHEIITNGKTENVYYVYGYNSEMGRHLVSKFGIGKFRELGSEVSLKTKGSIIVDSYFAIPWIFSEGVQKRWFRKE